MLWSEPRRTKAAQNGGSDRQAAEDGRREESGSATRRPPRQLRKLLRRCAPAVFPATLHLMMCWLVAWENAVLYLSDSVSPLVLFRALVFEQAQSLFVWLILVAVGLVAVRMRALVFLRAFEGLVCFLNLWVVLDQVAFKLYFQHLTLHMAEGATVSAADLPKLAGSLVGEMDPVTGVNVLVLVAGTVACARLTAAGRGGLRAMAIAQRIFGALVVLLGASLVVAVASSLATGSEQWDGISSGEANPVSTIRQHAVVAWMASALPEVGAGVASSLAGGAAVGSRPGLRSSHAGSHAEDSGIGEAMRLLEDVWRGPASTLGAGAPWSEDAPPASAQDLSDARDALRAATHADSDGGSGSGARRQLRHVVHVVLESVGSMQVLGENGRVREDVAPGLAALQALGSVTFPCIYCSFPSTSRSHVPMATGGPTSTQGSVNDQFPREYSGPTLARLLRAAGFRAGLFAASDLAFESLDKFLINQGYDTFHHYGSASPQFRREHHLNSWGGDDHSVAQLAAQWVLRNEEAGTPSYTHLLPDATHHPYSTPPGFERPFATGDTRWDNYRNSLHYTDASLLQLVQRLQEADLVKHTAFVVSGDHGEAFGQRHARNFIHKNFLYEENVRNFLLMAAPGALTGAKVSARVGCIGDIMPTVASWAAPATARENAALARRGVVAAPNTGLEVAWDRAPTSPATARQGTLASRVEAREGPGDAGMRRHLFPVLGQDLLSPAYLPRPCFFHKTAQPYQWGTRLGRYKFVANQVGSHAELYDLVEDPEEQTNLAPRWAPMVSVMHALVQRWYLSTHCEFVRRLEGYSADAHCDIEAAGDMRSQGPKRTYFGAMVQGSFRRLDPLPADTPRISLWTEWVPFDGAQTTWIDFAPLRIHRALARANLLTSSTLESGVLRGPRPPGEEEAAAAAARGKLRGAADDSGTALTEEEAAEAQSRRFLFQWAVQAGWHTTYYHIKPQRPLTVEPWELIIWCAALAIRAGTRALTPHLTHGDPRSAQGERFAPLAHRGQRHRSAGGVAGGAAGGGGGRRVPGSAAGGHRGPQGAGAMAALAPSHTHAHRPGE